MAQDAGAMSRPKGEPGDLLGPQKQLTLGFLAEVILATEELWECLPERYVSHGQKFLEGVLGGARDDRS
jgi:hypothetical protein